MTELAVSIGCDRDWRSVSDVELMTSLAWSTSAPEELAQAARSGRFSKFWRAWQKQIAARKVHAQAKRKGGDEILWPWSDRRLHPASGLLAMLEQRDWSKLTRWAKNSADDRSAWTDERTEQELLVLAHWLWSSPRLDEDTARPVWRLALIRSLELAAYLSKPLTCSLTVDRRLLVTGELPWLLSQLWNDVEGTVPFKQLAQQSLRNELLELTDGDGTPSGELLNVLPHWLASFTRSLHIADQVGEPLLEGEARYRFEDLVTKAVMLLDRDGCLLGVCREPVARAGRKSSAGDITPEVTLLLRACDLAKLDELSLAAESLRFREHFAKKGSRNKFHSETFSETPDERLIVTDSDLPATQSDWAGWACLRNWWHDSANTVVVRHDGPSVSLILSLLGRPVIAGEWGLTVRIGGKLLTWQEPWKCICWTSDTDMDYIELQQDWPDGPMVCRQVMLSRKDHFLVLADAVSRAGSQRVDLESTLPLIPAVRAKSDATTREIRLPCGDVKARCFPLALPDDRLLSTSGAFDVQPGQLRLMQAASSEGLYAPIVIDWSPERSTLDAEWRTLTVTEEGQKLAPWQASGFRWRLGKQHLVVYRSLQHTAESRAVLGLHTDRESVIAQFNEQGYVLPIVSVEG